ncbi:sodium-coupled monocarboxylate transporter 1-like [Haliotis rufescens]|uniref:sodium-coupled monocarboxylate transporter 1-like n=1 Tax=Haliotis rufescens TaxID=6454 RepID=UPI00201EC4B6|nr:sodium-coupled monocarboxylate transporter 1-like [Haliotis rufescens]
MSERFGWHDYLVLTLMLAVSAAIGLYHGCRRGGQKTTDEYLMGGRDMQFLPVAFSVLASFLSAITVLAVPVEIYLFGAAFWVNALSYFISVPITAHVFIPLFHRLKLRSVYEYLELRFNYSVRVMGCLVFTLQMMVYMAVVFYAPALVFSQVSGMSMLVSILAIGGVCTIYTTLGGLKAVVWTDVFQIVIVISGILALIIKGTIEVGGARAVWQKASEGGRLENVFDFDPDPLKRHTFWSLVFGGSITTLSIYAINQALVQRYLAVKKLRHAQGTIYFNLPSNIIATTLMTGVGLVTYAKYKDCDPYKSGKMTKFDQLVPLLVMETLGMVPGLAGLFISCVFSAALSTVSSGVNALALVHLEDIIKPCYKTLTGTAMREKLGTVISKVLTLLFGLLTVGLAFLAGKMGGTMLQITLSSFGMTGGPLLGLFLLAIFVPFATTPGAVAALFSGLVFSLWVVIGSTVNGSRPPILNITTDGCDVMSGFNSTYSTPTTMRSLLSNMTVVMVNTTLTADSPPPPPMAIYRLSYMWYSGTSVLVAFTVGVIISILTGGLRKPDVNPELVINVWKKLKTLVSRNKQQYVLTDETTKLETHCLPESVHLER